MGELARIEMPLLAATRRINDGQRGLLVERLRVLLGDDLRGHRIALWCRAFKPGTDDMREAPSGVVVDALLAMGASALLVLTE